MSLADYSVDLFGNDWWDRFQSWYEAFADDPRWLLIRRNLDRECNRNDIERAIWNEFLSRLAIEWGNGRQPNPCETVDNVIRGDRSYFSLPGKQFSPPTNRIYRYIHLNRFWKDNLRNGITHQRPSTLELISQIDEGDITGSDMENTMLGQVGDGVPFPVWCTDESLAQETSANVIRDRLALKHVEGGYLVEVAYPLSSLELEGAFLQAPTFLDASAKGSEQWIWVKNRHAGTDPFWGYTVDMMRGSGGGEGVPEAVHKPVPISGRFGAEIQLRPLGPISRSPVQMDFAAMLDNPDL